MMRFNAIDSEIVVNLADESRIVSYHGHYKIPDSLDWIDALSVITEERMRRTNGRHLEESIVLTKLAEARKWLKDHGG